MGIVKAFIGGLIGAVIATVVLMVLRDGSMRGYEWFPLVTGLLTGLGARLLAGGMGRSLATGVVAAVLSMLAILSGDELPQILKMRSTGDLGPIQQVVQREAAMSKVKAAGDSEEAEGSAAKESEASASPEDNADETEAAEPAADPGVAAVQERGQSREAAARAGLTSGSSLPPVKRPKTMKEFLPFIFSGLGVLIAYQLGRGTPPAKVAAHETAASTTSEQVEEAVT